MVRSFIAVDIDDDALLNKIIEIQRAITECGADLKVVERENMHLTLRFLGEVGESLIPEIFAIIKEIKFKPIELALKGVGVFPNILFIRVIWVGIAKGEKELSQIASELNVQLRPVKIPSDTRGFSPHLTIARVRSQRNIENVLTYLHEWQDRDFGGFTVNSIKLKKSILTPTGPIYANLLEKTAEL